MILRTALARKFRMVLPLGLTLMLLPMAATPLFAQTPGITATEILLGQSADLAGPTKEIGTNMRDGALLYFKHINTNGGIHGRKIRLITMDDGYDANRCAANTRRLIEKDKVFMLFGYTGTPTSERAVALAEAGGVPFFGPVTGAEFLRTPVKHLVFNIRASYFQETDAIVKILHEERGVTRFSVFYLNGDYGQAGLTGVKMALAKYHSMLVNTAGYDMKNPDVSAAVKHILAGNPQAVIIIGVPDPHPAAFIKAFRETGNRAYIAGISPVNGEVLGQRLLNIGVGVMVSQVVPYPYYKETPVVAEYHRMIGLYMPEHQANFAGMEGFIDAKALCKIFEDMPDTMTREDFVKTAESETNVDLGGMNISFSPTSHQGSNKVFFTQIVPGGFLKPIARLSNLYEY
jgi:ABC-type branched-subunit amino acid transport system substrate-binding protein